MGNKCKIADKKPRVPFLYEAVSSFMNEEYAFQRLDAKMHKREPRPVERKGQELSAQETYSYL